MSTDTGELAQISKVPDEMGRHDCTVKKIAPIVTLLSQSDIGCCRRKAIMWYCRTLGLIKATIINSHLLILNIGVADGRKPSKARLRGNALPFFFDIANLRQTIAPTSNNMNTAIRININMRHSTYTKCRSRSRGGKHQRNKGGGQNRFLHFQCPLRLVKDD